LVIDRYEIEATDGKGTQGEITGNKLRRTSLNVLIGIVPGCPIETEGIEMANFIVDGLVHPQQVLFGLPFFQLQEAGKDEPTVNGVLYGTE
jgi:hypothetical protein